MTLIRNVVVMLIIVLLLIAAGVFLTSCADNKRIDGNVYRSYGILNQELYKNDSIQYEVSPCAVCSGIIFCELIVPPIYVFGYNLYEPMGKKTDFLKTNTKGIIGQPRTTIIKPAFT